MRNLKLIIAYDGTDYAGWQKQKQQPTIQGVLEEKIAVMAGRHETVHGAGRTDAGVHALGMAANFLTDCSIPCEGFVKGLNSLLPNAIRVRSASEVASDFHARCSARGKAYFYNLSLEPVQLPTERLYHYNIHGGLDLPLIDQCLDMVVGEHDFSSFEASGSRDREYDKGRGAIRTIFTAVMEKNRADSSKLKITLAGDGFLRHMVRNIVGTLIEVGQGKMSVEGFRQVLMAKDRTLAGPTAPAHGLFLKEVYY